MPYQRQKLVDKLSGDITNHPHQKVPTTSYGLKQSPRAWFERFEKTVKSYGYTQNQADHTMFFKHYGDGKKAILIVYVDDIIITGNDRGEIEELKRKLA